MQEEYELGCCVPLQDVACAVRAQFDQGGVPALLARLKQLRDWMFSRSPHYDVFSAHAVMLAVEQACGPLLYRVWQAGTTSEPLLSEAERRQVVQAVNDLEQALHKLVLEELHD